MDISLRMPVGAGRAIDCLVFCRLVEGPARGPDGWVSHCLIESVTGWIGSVEFVGE